MTDHHIHTNRGKGLSKAKQALLARRLRGNLNRMPQTDTIPVRANTGSIPLSYAQGRFWFLYQLDPRNPAYHMYNVVRLQGRLDIAILTKSFITLIQRHQILRTQFVAESSPPIQQIVTDINFEIPVTDLQSYPRSEKESPVQGWIRSEIRCPFDLTRCPLLRVSLLKQNDDDHILVLTIHHIISDEWSNELLWRELSILYRAFLSDQSPTLPNLPVQYADFTLWQKQRVNKQMETQFAYWKKQLDVDLSLLQLPTDHIRPAQQAFRGALKWVSFPDELSLRLKALNQAFGTTTFMTLLTAFQVLLHRYTRQTDILIGTPIANRKRPEIKNLIGLFLNTLVMRANFKDNPRFDDLVKQTRQTALDGYAHQDLPFEKLVDGLQPQRNTSYNPIFQVMFVHQKSAFEEIDIPGLTVSQMPVDIGVAKFDLTLFVEESSQGLSAGLEYNTDLFDSNTADRILGHFQTLLESIVEDPQQRVSNLQLITAAERDMLMHKWNNTRIGTPQPPQIQQFIEQRAAQNSEAVAVVDDANQLTYRELDRRANQLARFMLKIGVGNTPVGLVLERSTDMIVAILGVLKAGGAYLPLDPASPPERLAFMLSDTQAPVLLTQKKIAGTLPDHKAKMVFIDAEWDVIAREDNTVPCIAAAPENLAYVIYTSGSTGKPKGVPVSHRNLVHSTSARFQFYEKNVNRFLLLSSFTFDSSVVGIFWTLCQGGTLVLPPQRIEQDIQKLVATIASRKISHILTLPSLYAILLEQADAKQLASLNTVIVAGEACRRGLVDLHYNRLPNAILFNEYGPTECTVWSTAYKIPATFEGNRVPIGRPIPNTQNYILDSHDQLVPIGVPGELCIGGAGVTSGYLNRPDLTAEKFIEYAIAGEPPTRLYRTGDLARYLPDGIIEFLGRIDHQVKLRGFRIEPGEVATVIGCHPAVLEAVVIVQETNRQTKQLVAYVVGKNNDDQFLSDLKRFLKARLPDYMIPSVFVVIERMPRTENGKIDRGALPAAIRKGVDVEKRHVSPRNPLEAELSRIWCKHLRVDNVGVMDNFFELGGDSLLALGLIADIKKKTGNHISLSALLNNPTIEGLARSPTQTYTPPPKDSSLVPIQSEGNKAPLLLFGCPPEIYSSFENDQPLYRFLSFYDELPFLYTVDRLETIAATYIRDLKRSLPDGPYVLCGYSAGGLIAYEMARQLSVSHGETPFLFLIDPPRLNRIESDHSSPVDTFDNRIHRFAPIIDAARENPISGAVLFIEKSINKIKNETKWLTYFVLHKMSKMMRFHIPLRWRSRYGLHLYGVVIRQYTARPYSGPVTLCQTEMSIKKADWAKILKGDVELHLIEEGHNHSDLFHDMKTVKIWFNHLKFFLDRIKK